MKQQASNLMTFDHRKRKYSGFRPMNTLEDNDPIQKPRTISRSTPSEDNLPYDTHVPTTDTPLKDLEAKNIKIPLKSFISDNFKVEENCLINIKKRPNNYYIEFLMNDWKIPNLTLQTYLTKEFKYCRATHHLYFGLSAFLHHNNTIIKTICYELDIEQEMFDKLVKKLIYSVDGDLKGNTHKTNRQEMLQLIASIPHDEMKQHKIPHLTSSSKSTIPVLDTSSNSYSSYKERENISHDDRVQRNSVVKRQNESIPIPIPRTKSKTSFTPDPVAVPELRRVYKSKTRQSLGSESTTSSSLSDIKISSKKDLINRLIMPRPESLKQQSEPTKKQTPKFGPTVIYTFKDSKQMPISISDFNTLNKDQFLNDTVINFFLKRILDEAKTRDSRIGDSTYIFNTFFYEKLTQGDLNTNTTYNEKSSVANAKFQQYYENVKRWTSKIDLFKMKNVIIPIHLNSHWFVSIIYNLPALERKLDHDSDDKNESNEDKDGTKETPIKVDSSNAGASLDNYIAPINPEKEPVIFILDSLNTRRGGVAKNLRSYITKEALDKRGLHVEKRDIKYKLCSVPTQPNFCDCGVYLIHFVESFLKNPERIAKLWAESDHREDISEKLNILFEPPVSKREVLQRSLLELYKDPNATIRAPTITDKGIDSNDSVDDEPDLEIIQPEETVDDSIKEDEFQEKEKMQQPTLTQLKTKLTKGSSTDDFHIGGRDLDMYKNPQLQKNEKDNEQILEYDEKDIRSSYFKSKPSDTISIIKSRSLDIFSRDENSHDRDRNYNLKDSKETISKRHSSPNKNNSDMSGIENTTGPSTRPRILKQYKHKNPISLDSRNENPQVSTSRDKNPEPSTFDFSDDKDILFEYGKLSEEKQQLESPSQIRFGLNITDSDTDSGADVVEVENGYEKRHTINKNKLQKVEKDSQTISDSDSDSSSEVLTTSRKPDKENYQTSSLSPQHRNSLNDSISRQISYRGSLNRIEKPRVQPEYDYERKDALNTEDENEDDDGAEDDDDEIQFIKNGMSYSSPMPQKPHLNLNSRINSNSTSSWPSSVGPEQKSTRKSNSKDHVNLQSRLKRPISRTSNIIPLEKMYTRSYSSERDRKSSNKKKIPQIHTLSDDDDDMVAITSTNPTSRQPKRARKSAVSFFDSRLENGTLPFNLNRN